MNGTKPVCCRMHYREALRPFCPHGERGRILLTHRGKRLMHLDSGRRIVCPMWNAVPILREVRGGEAEEHGHL